MRKNIMMFIMIILIMIGTISLSIYWIYDSQRSFCQKWGELGFETKQDFWCYIYGKDGDLILVDTNNIEDYFEVRKLLIEECGEI